MKKLFLSLLFILITCFPSFGAEMESFTLGLPGDAKTLDPHQAVDTLSFIVTKHINEPLVSGGPPGRGLRTPFSTASSRRRV